MGKQGRQKQTAFQRDPHPGYISPETRRAVNFMLGAPDGECAMCGKELPPDGKTWHARKACGCVDELCFSCYEGLDIPVEAGRN